ncbi:MAG TPA: 2Fe-2S iron-sulfur cluster-binding protein [Paraburkholderia sp.]
MPTITVSGTSLSFTSAPGDTVLQAALRAGVPWPYECSVGSCGTCRFTIDAGEARVLRDDPPGLSAMDRRKHRKLACQCVAESDLSVSAKIGVDGALVQILPRRVPAVFVGARTVTHDMIEYRFRTAATAQFLPGQYALLTLPGMSEARAYSMSNVANEQGEWTFVIRNVPNGVGSRALGTLETGTTITIDGPYGGAWLRTDVPREIVCIAGGSGLAPMLSIARAASATEHRLHFYYGARTAADACSRAFVAELDGFDARMRCIEAISIEDEDKDKDNSDAIWQGETGLIHDVVARDLTGPFDAYEFYVSGPPPMISAVLNLLAVERGVPTSQIHFDRFF